MHAKEQLRIKFFLEMAYRFTQQITFAFRANADVILLGANPANARNRQKQNSTPRFENNSVGIGVGSVLGLVSRRRRES